MAQRSRSTSDDASARTTRPSASSKTTSLSGEAPAYSPMDVLNDVMARASEMPNTFTEESLLSVKYDVTVQKYGVEFERTIWVSSELQSLTSLPGKWRKDQYRLEVRYDAAAASRDMLTSILVLARAQDGRVIARVHCVPKEEALATLDRERQAESTRKYLTRLVGDREDAEVDWVELHAGAGASRRQRALQHEVARRRRAQTNTRGTAPASATRTPVVPTASAEKTKSAKQRKDAKGRATAGTSTTRPSAQRGRRVDTRAASTPTPSSATRDALDTVSAQFLAADRKRRGSP